MKPPLTSVYELINSTKKEFLIWIGDDGKEPAESDLAALLPAHWNGADQVTAHTVESGLERKEALAFRDNYAKNMGQMPGWSVRVVGPES